LRDIPNLEVGIGENTLNFFAILISCPLEEYASLLEAYAYTTHSIRSVRLKEAYESPICAYAYR
jgi:hypothetical protein